MVLTNALNRKMNTFFFPSFTPQSLVPIIRSRWQRMAPCNALRTLCR
uniref:Uncharacterized protein n=1 Tax=Arundo donax TaxID=35708 RepID=A0A0A9DA72_ARUDO